MFDPSEPFLPGGGRNPAIDNQGGRAVVVERGYAEDVQVAPFPNALEFRPDWMRRVPTSVPSQCIHNAGRDGPRPPCRLSFESTFVSAAFQRPDSSRKPSSDRSPCPPRAPVTKRTCRTNGSACPSNADSRPPATRALSWCNRRRQQRLGLFLLLGARLGLGLVFRTFGLLASGALAMGDLGQPEQ